MHNITLLMRKNTGLLNLRTYKKDGRNRPFCTGIANLYIFCTKFRQFIL